MIVFMQYHVSVHHTQSTCKCSALFGNLRNFEIALRILSIAKLRANFEIAYAISTRQLRNLEMEMSEQDTPALDSSDHTFLQ